MPLQQHVSGASSRNLMPYHEATIATYNRAAAGFSAKYDALPARIDDIERARHLADKPSQPQIVEIGCGNGRDAAAALQMSRDYLGFDPSSGLLAIARQRLPNARLEQADALSAHYPEADLVIAFTSLLHVTRNEFAEVCHRVRLRPGGIFMISLKENGQDYAEETVVDEFGERRFCYYSPATVRALAGTAFEAVYEEHALGGTNEWITALRYRPEAGHV